MEAERGAVVETRPLGRSADQLRLMAKIALMYHKRGMRQAEIAAELHVSQPRVSRLLKAAAESGPLKNILVYTEDPIVSADIVHTPQSSTVDGLETTVMEGKLARVVSWYDNEWGFSNRMVDTAAAMGKLI